MNFEQELIPLNGVLVVLSQPNNNPNNKTAKTVVDLGENNC